MAQRKGVSIKGRREEREPDVELTTPHGTSIVVDSKRAEALLKRAPLQFGDGKMRRYAPAGEDIEVEPEVSGAQPPRKGSRENTEE